MIINIVSFFAYGIDKFKAKTHSWRISERTLFSLALLGGSIGALVGMFVFWHKIKKSLFKYGVPLCLFVDLLVFLYFRSVYG